MPVSSFGRVCRFVTMGLVSLAAGLVCLAFPSFTVAQTELAAVYGRVTDSSGGVIVDAEIEIKNVETNLTLTVKTNQDGLYSIPALHPGHYLISARKPGFKTVTVTDVELNIQDNVVRNFTLQAGSISETLTIHADDGLADPENIGIIGFSRSCYYVMETLTTSSLRLKAASITDGIMLDYFQAAQKFGDLGEAKAMIGAAPFREGLQLWLKRSPGFNLDKVKTPLRVVGIGRSGVLDMWGAVRGASLPEKPVDLIMLNAHAHVLTNPAQRLAAQTGTVDWFRFWLQGYEDPDPAKAEQYKRWRGMRELQEQNDKKRAVQPIS